jgi:hypothetical protein
MTAGSRHSKTKIPVEALNLKVIFSFTIDKRVGVCQNENAFHL